MIPLSLWECQERLTPLREANPGIMLARDVLAAAHQRFALVLRDRADEAQLEALDEARVGFNAAGDGRGVTSSNKCSLSSTPY